MLDRASTFADPKIVNLLQTRFVPAAIDQFYQRYRIVVQKKTGPTGDPYFSYDFQYAGEIANEDDAKMMRGLYDQYSKSGFVADMADEAADIDTARHTEGTRRDYGAARREIDDEIPF